MTSITAHARSGSAVRRVRSRGFSLIELSVVLVIIGLLIGGGIAALDATRTQIKRSDQAYQLEDIRDALYGFAMVNGRLPCPDDPDNDIDGEQDRRDSDDTCRRRTGVLPYATLGLGYRDAWGYPLIYHVDRAFADAPFDLDEPDPDRESADSVTIEDGNGGVIAATPAVVVSVGPQGNQVWNDTPLPFCPGDSEDDTVTDGFSDHETDNCDVRENNRFIDAAFRTADADAGRFDDMLIWISTPLLKAKLVEAETLP